MLQVGFPTAEIFGTNIGQIVVAVRIRPIRAPSDFEKSVTLLLEHHDALVLVGTCVYLYWDSPMSQAYFRRSSILMIQNPASAVRRWQEGMSALQCRVSQHALVDIQQLGCKSILI
jgi:hypothetical protein